MKVMMIHNGDWVELFSDCAMSPCGATMAAYVSDGKHLAREKGITLGQILNSTLEIGNIHYSIKRYARNNYDMSIDFELERTLICL